MTNPVRVRSEDILGEEVDAASAGRTREELHPKVVEDLARLPVAVSGVIQVLNLAPHTCRQPLEKSMDLGSVERTESNPDCSVSDRIDVAADGGAAELLRFPDGSSAPHEWIEYYYSGQAQRLVEQIHDRAASGRGSGDYRGAKHGPQALRPPLVDVVDGPIYLLPPALDFRDLAYSFKRKILLYRTWAVLSRLHWRARRAASCCRRRRAPSQDG